MISNRLFVGAVFLTLALKFVLAALIPPTGDEVYYYVWGRNLDLGYFDHPPMIGWWMGLLSAVSESLLWIRLPAILLSTFVGILLYVFARRDDEQKARWIAVWFLIVPFHLFGVIMATDTPFIFFGVISCFAFFSALRDYRVSKFIVSGVFLGLALLSKYFFVYFAIAYVVPLFWSKHRLKYLKGVAVVGIVSSLFLIPHVYWNSENCWANFVFNFSGRHKGEGFGFDKVGLFLIYQIYLLTPFLVWALVRDRQKIFRRFDTHFHLPVLMVFLVPLVLFFFTSFKYGQGIHWMLGFYPALYLVLSKVLDLEQIRRLTKQVALFSLIHFILFGAVGVLPDSMWKRFPFYSNYVLFRYSDEVKDQIENLLGDDDTELAAQTYSTASLLSFEFKRDIHMIGWGAKFGRHFDWTTNYKELDSKKVVVFSRRTPDQDLMSRIFTRTNLQTIEVRGARFFLLMGDGFRYPWYRNRVLSLVKERYYPDSVRLYGASCPLLDRHDL